MKFIYLFFTILILAKSGTEALQRKYVIELLEPPVALSYNGASRRLSITNKAQLLQYERNQTGQFAESRGTTIGRGKWQAQQIGQNVVCIDSSLDGELIVVTDLKSGQKSGYMESFGGISYHKGFGEDFLTSLGSLSNDKIFVGFQNGSIGYTAISVQGADSFRIMNTTHRRITKAASAGDIFAVCGPQSYASVYPSRKGNVQQEFVAVFGERSSKGCDALDLSASGKDLAVATLAGEIFIFNFTLENGYQLIRRFWSPIASRQTALKWSKSGEYLLVASDDQLLTLYSRDDNFEKPIFSKFGEFLPVVEWTEDEQEFLVGRGRTVEVYSLVKSRSREVQNASTSNGRANQNSLTRNIRLIDPETN